MSDSESSGKLRAPTELVKKQGGSLRIVLIGLGCLTFIALLALGSFFYFAYRIEKEEQRTEKSLTNPSADSSKPSSKVERREVCSLITKEEMKEVIGMEMIEATTNATGDTCICKYSGGKVLDTATLDVNWEDGRLIIKRIKSRTRPFAVFPGAAVEDVPGLGDEAIFIAGAMFARKGDVVMDIQLPTALLLKENSTVGGVQVIKEKERKLLEKGLARL